MSWDIHISDLPDVASVSDIPEDFQPSSLGSRDALIGKIIEVFPLADFHDPSWGLIDGDVWSIEVNIGNEAECDGIMLHVRGGGSAVKAAAAIIDHLGFPAIDIQTGEFFSLSTASASFQVWRAYRDQIAGANRQEPKKRGLFSRIFS